MNLQKYTKAELISKFKELKSNSNTNNSKILDYVYVIKTFIVKFTFLTLIIKIFKRFKILRRIWLILNTIVMSIFGISMLDIYGLTFLSAFITEITEISKNIINYLSNTKFYTVLKGLLGYKIETPTKMESLNRIDTSTTKLPTEIETKSKLSNWFNQQEEVIEDTPFYKNKYFIYGTVFVISCLTYYYFGEEIKVYSISAWDWLRSRRPGNDPGNNNPDNRNNSWVNLIGLNRNNARDLNLTDLDEPSVLFDSSDKTELPANIELVSAKGKVVDKSPVLSSPSLEDLNSQAQNTWSKSRPTSPESVTSNETIKPTINPSPQIGTSSTNVFKHDEIPKQLIEQTVAYSDEALFPDGTVKPFLIKQTKSVKFISKDNWRLFINKGIKGRMEFIENTFNSENELDLETANKLVDEITVITKSYDSLTEFYDISKDSLTDRKVKLVKAMSYNMRGWLKDYSTKIFPNNNINIPKGLNIDSPKIISKSIFTEED